MAEISLGDVDIEAVLLRLTRHAQGLFGAVRSLGVEPVDIAYAGGESANRHGPIVSLARAGGSFARSLCEALKRIINVGSGVGVPPSAVYWKQDTIPKPGGLGSRGRNRRGTSSVRQAFIKL